MRYLLDTGILLRLPDRSDPFHSVVREAVRGLSPHELVTATQNIAEFWNVCTRPSTARGGLGLAGHEAQRRLRLLERLVVVLREPPSAYERWKTLVMRCKVQRRQVHDARLVALMKAYRIKRVLTLNAPDFARYPGVEAITPQNVVRDLSSGQ
ncbi:MAG TPA: type II toxin-antitoxin system VapC family toxin [Phycisphaerae bacterium]|nr:type II toxin-antitoxin system VapC family toxin [Phycisphaerae bacterium]